MSTTFEKQKLQATFTFRIMEIVKRMKIHPIPRATEVPWGLSLAAGIILAILSFNPHMSIFDPVDIPTGPPLSAKMKMLEVGEIPVAMLEVSQMLVLAGDQEDGDSRHGRPPGLGAPPPDSRAVIKDDSTSSEPGDIRGKVTDTAFPTQHDLEGAVVTVRNDKLLAAEGGKRSVTAGLNGEYLIDNLPPGEYIVTVTNPGYEPSEERVIVLPRAEAFHDVRMHLKGTKLGPPEFVTASRRQMRMWRGVLDIDGNILRIVLKLTTFPPYTATMDSLDQNLEDIPVDNILFDYENLNFGIKSINATFEGKIKEGGSSTVEGEWKQDEKSLPLTLYRYAERKPEPRRPQYPEKPYPYKEEEVIYRNRKAGVILAGTLTLPDSDGPFPAIILLSDYGVDDRDEFQPGLGHRPFLVLADYLTRQGMAVLRTDDRGMGWSTGHLFESTFADLADDAVAGIEYLKSRKEVEPGKINLIGWRTGGSVALAATELEDVASVVLMGGIGLSGEESLLLSIPLILKSVGESDREIAKQSEIYRRMFAVLKQEEDDEIAMQKIRNVIADVTVEYSETKLSEEEIQAIRTSSGDAHFNKLNPYFRSFLIFDPRPDLMKLKCPVLVLRKPTKQNMDAIEEALKTGGNKHYIIKVLPGINERFQTIQPGVPISEIEETISPIVLKLIGDWLLEQTK